MEAVPLESRVGSEARHRIEGASERGLAQALTKIESTIADLEKETSDPNISPARLLTLSGDRIKLTEARELIASRIKVHDVQLFDTGDEPLAN